MLDKGKLGNTHTEHVTPTDTWYQTRLVHTSGRQQVSAITLIRVFHPPVRVALASRLTKLQSEPTRGSRGSLCT
jgi:hypothetical protein